MTQIQYKSKAAGTRIRLNTLSRVMDTSIRLPGGYRIGWDGIVGLIPGVGDLVGMGISLYILVGATRLGASKTTLLRMLGNIGVETAVGSIPIVGDLFDLAFKANTRNMKILDNQIVDPTSTQRQSNTVLLIFLILAVVLMLLIAWLIVSFVFGLLTLVF